MPPTYSRTELLDMLEHARLYLHAAVSGLGNERLETELVGPGWTVRDIVAHLAGWEKEFHHEARRLAERDHVHFDYRIDPADDWQEWNAKQVEMRRGRRVGEIFLELEKEQMAVVEWVRRVQERRLKHETVFPWGGAGTVSYLLSVLAGHKVGHAERIREWRVERGYRR